MVVLLNSFLREIGIGTSGQPQIYVVTDASASGQARLYWEAY